ncbi:DoxX family protein [Paralcaligenes sp. KSB-10]|uniref:DoxX family protein n=1 Tax=Paralcaligenes sp. KSB-10 TaxID=2901142 RepID=UPI001E2E2C52|nr:DoxX family protein [Paralcaligenes sp. KSB-10]UHL65703.1 DoxX family protein [Paralcaligenes sp. KSB-10]
MSANSHDDLGKLVLRLTLGILLLLHGISKILHGTSFIANMATAHGLPAFFAWAVYLGEVLAPVLIILGLYTRLGGLLAAINMVVALALVHSAQLFHLSNNGGAQVELQYFYLFGSVAILLLGAGRYSVGGKGGSWN